MSGLGVKKRMTDLQTRAKRPTFSPSSRRGAGGKARLCASVSPWLILFLLTTPSHGADGPAPVPLPVAEVKREAPVDFEKEILPILSSNCLACHNRTKSKADL